MTRRDDAARGSCVSDSSQVSDPFDALRAWERLSRELQRARAAGLELLLTQDQPVEQGAWARKAGIDESTFSGVVDDAVDRGRVELDPVRRLVGVAGLTLAPTRHRIQLRGKTRWTWCALDALGIFGALQASGTLHSADPATSREIVIDFSHGVAQGDAALFIVETDEGVHVRSDWCPLVNLFESRTSAEQWAAERHLGGSVTTVADTVAHAADMWRPVVELSGLPIGGDPCD